MFCDYGSANLDDGELLRRDGGEMGKVLLDFSLGTNVAQQLNDGRACVEVPSYESGI